MKRIEYVCGEYKLSWKKLNMDVVWGVIILVADINTIDSVLQTTLNYIWLLEEKKICI